jgi:LEA14-like dessication related protein
MAVNPRTTVRFILSFGLLAGLAGCANLNQLLNQMDVKKPVVTVRSVDLTEISFTDATLRFNMEIENPNGFGVKLDGFDYRFDINQKNFLNGDQPDKIDIAAGKKSPFAVPVSVNFSRLLDTVTDLVNDKSADYKIDLGLRFDLPVLGNTRIPVAHSGTLPIPKIPSIGVSALELKKMSLTGADLELVLKIGNPNIFGFDLNNLDYNFMVNGNRWVEGSDPGIGTINAGGEGLVRIPVSLNFLELGRSAANLISGGSDLNYGLTGNLDISGKELPLRINGLKFERSGSVNLTK